MRALFFLLIIVPHTGLCQTVFTEVSSLSGINHKTVFLEEIMAAQGGAAWFDYNNDGWYDLYVTGGGNSDALYQNEGDGTFSDQTVNSGIAAMSIVKTDGVTTGDYNRDGWTDIVVTTYRGEQNHLLKNNGDGTFDNIEWAAETDTGSSFSACFGDLNLDGFLDLFVCNWPDFLSYQFSGGEPVSVAGAVNYYYENQGDGTFDEVSTNYGLDDPDGCGLGVIFSDYDNDQDLDIYLANDFGFFPENSENRLFRNDYPLDQWTEVSAINGLNVGMNGMGVAKADINSDGLFDFYVTNINNDILMISSQNGYENELIARGLDNDTVWLQGFVDTEKKTGWGCAFVDVDNDMDEDLLTANGSLQYDYPNPALDYNKLFLNNGAGYFTDYSVESGVDDPYVSRALAYCDYDLDGDIDVFIGVTDTVNGSSHSFLYRNESTETNWFQVKAEGVVSNLDGIGTRVSLYTDGVLQIREIGGESSFNSQHWYVAHFGLGAHQTVDSIIVSWPGGGVDKFYDLTNNQLFEAVEGQGQGPADCRRHAETSGECRLFGRREEAQRDSADGGAGPEILSAG